jgi:hypothetical protein
MVFSELLYSTLCSRGTSKAQIFRYAAGCVLRTFATAFSLCLEKSPGNAQIAASLSLLREPRSRPAGDEIGIQERTPSIENLTVKRRYLTEREVERLMAGFCSRPV